MSQYCRKKTFYAGYLAKFMFLKRCRAFNLDPTAEFFKEAGVVYSGNEINENNDNNDSNDDSDDSNSDTNIDDDDNMLFK